VKRAIRFSPEPGKGSFTLDTAPYLIESIATQSSGTGLKAVCFSVHRVKKKYILLTDARRADTGLQE